MRTIWHGRRNRKLIQANKIPEIAEDVQHAAQEKASSKTSAQSAGLTSTAAPAGSGLKKGEGASNGSGQVKEPPNRHFYGTIDLDPIKAKKQFSDLVDEIILQFTSRPGVKVKIAIEIQAESSAGFEPGIQRTVKENCNVLRFKSAEFEQGE